MTQKRSGVRRSAAEWTEIVRSWRASGETARQYASNHGLNAGTLKWWSRRVSKPAAEPVSRFAKVVVKPPAVTGSELEVVAPSGHRVVVRGAVDAGCLRDVLEVLKTC